MAAKSASAIKITGALAYTGYLTWLLFFAAFREGTSTAVNLIPFKTIWSMTHYTFTTGNDWWYWLVNVPGNIVAPSARFQKNSWARCAASRSARPTF